MNRKSQNILILVALVGVAATGFLLINLSLDDRAPQRQANSSADSGGPGGYRPGGVQEVQSSHPKSGRIKRGPTNSATNPGRRKPYDSPRTSVERRQATTRVLEILEIIQNSKDLTTNRKLHRELKQLIRKLGHRVPKSVRDDLLEMIDSVEPRWRRLVGDTLGALSGDKDTAKKLIEKLKARPDDVQTIQAITLALGSMNVKEAIPELNKMLRADFPQEVEIVRAISSIGGREASTLLSEHLGKSLDSRTRVAIERALSQMRDPAVLKRLESGLASIKDATTRRSFYSVLGNTRDPKYAEGVRNALKDEPVGRGRRAAIRALGLFGDAESGKVLLEMIQHGATNDRTEATNALYHIRDSETINALAKNYHSLNDDARVAVMGAAARVPKPSKEIREHAKDGLRSSSRRLRSFSALLLGRAGNDGAVNHLVEFANRHPSEKRAALQALDKIKTKKAAEAALDLLPRMGMHELTRKSWERKFKQLLKRK